MKNRIVTVGGETRFACVDGPEFDVADDVTQTITDAVILAEMAEIESAVAEIKSAVTHIEASVQTVRQLLENVS